MNVTKLHGNLKPKTITAVDYSKREGRTGGWVERSRGGWQGKSQKQRGMREDLGGGLVLNESLAVMFDFLPNSLQPPGDAEQLQGWKSQRLADPTVSDMQSCADCCHSIVVCLRSPPT